MASSAAPRAWLIAIACSLGVFAGCDVEEGAMASLDAQALPEQFACGDVTAVAAAPDGSEALLIGIDDGLAESARDSDARIVEHYTLPDPRVTVRWVVGTNVYQGQCGRDLGGPWALDERLDALDGQVVVEVERGLDGELALHARIEHAQFGDGLRLDSHAINASIEP
jgi:hypothetical protein